MLGCCVGIDVDVVVEVGLWEFVGCRVGVGGGMVVWLTALNVGCCYGGCGRLYRG